MASFGELVLVLGDFHVPERASGIPDSFKRMLVPNKMQHVLCTGNVSREQYDELCGLAPNVHVVRGDFDGMVDDGGGMTTAMPLPQFPEAVVVTVGRFRIGLVHGHQLLPYGSHDAIARMRRRLDVDILVTGHTHQNEVVLRDGQYYHINPGSVTGAYSSLTPDVTPSFILLAVQDTKLVCYVYELNGKTGDVEVSKTEFTKTVPPTSDPSSSPSGGPGSDANRSLMQSLLT